MSARVHSVNVGAVRSVERGGQTIETAIFKEPVQGRVPLRGVNLRGDDQADRSVHGGPFQAVYAYAREDYDWWQVELARDLLPGQFGENLTTSGIDVNAARVGERWRVGSAVLQVTTPRIPCYKLAMKMSDPKFIKRFAKALRPGAYFSVIEEGEMAQEDAIEIVSRPDHALTIARMAQIVLFEHESARELLVPELPASWNDWVKERL
jgi:MOSC domain-containing protein YiiM